MLTSVFGLASNTVEYTYEESPRVVYVATSSPIGVDDIKSKIAHYASIYGVSEDLMNHIVKYESGYKPTARNFNPPIEDSCGLVQINTLSHKITCDQAKDIDFALNFLATNLKEGNCRIWTTCFIPRSY